MAIWSSFQHGDNDGKGSGYLHAFSGCEWVTPPSLNSHCLGVHEQGGAAPWCKCFCAFQSEWDHFRKRERVLFSCKNIGCCFFRRITVWSLVTENYFFFIFNWNACTSFLLPVNAVYLETRLRKDLSTFEKKLQLQSTTYSKHGTATEQIWYFPCLGNSAENSVSVVAVPRTPELQRGRTRPFTLINLFFCPGPSTDDVHASHVAIATDRFDWQIQGSFWNF